VGGRRETGNEKREEGRRGDGETGRREGGKDWGRGAGARGAGRYRCHPQRRIVILSAAKDLARGTGKPLRTSVARPTPPSSPASAASRGILPANALAEYPAWVGPLWKAGAWSVLQTHCRGALRPLGRSPAVLPGPSWARCAHGKFRSRRRRRGLALWAGNLAIPRDGTSDGPFQGYTSTCIPAEPLAEHPAWVGSLGRGGRSQQDPSTSRPAAARSG
jgi:hypothetical protein